MQRKFGLKPETIMSIKSFARRMKYILFVRYRTKLKISQLVKSGVPVKLEIGAGEAKGKNGWTTLDMNSKCDIQWDLREGIPFPDNSISIIYSSHLFEHIPYKGIISVLKECHRVLQKDGVFSVCVPNARPHILGYANADRSFWNSIPAFYEPALTHNSLIDMINYIAYMDDEHKYMFDEDNLVSIIGSNGFKDARTRPFNPELDLKERDLESIYAIATVDK